MNLNMRKRTFERVRPAKIQISLRTRTVCKKSSLSAVWMAKDVKFLPADN